jgi:hypothetical protein
MRHLHTTISTKNSMNKIVAITSIGITAMLPFSQVHAFGMGDLLNIGIQAGTKVIGAAVDAGVDEVADAMRDPVAEAEKKREEQQKLVEQYQRQVGEIETRSDLAPLQRERMVMSLKNQYGQAEQFKAFLEASEAQQRAERDKLLTAGGILGTVGEATLNSPGVVMARADAMFKNPVYREQMRAQNQALIGKTDAMLAAGVPQSHSKQMIALADTAMQNELGGTFAATLDKASANSASIEGAPLEPEAAQQAAPLTSAVNSEQVIPVAYVFEPDIGRKLWVEFIGAPTETRLLRDRLAVSGHVMALSREEADVTYLIEGEFVVKESAQHGGVVQGVGELLENPSQPVSVPDKKSMGSIKRDIASFLFRAAALQGQKAPIGATQERSSYRQEVLLVLARQPRDGRETRVSVVKSIDDNAILAAKLATDARDTLYGRIGI